jgi:transcriptional regulator
MHTYIPPHCRATDDAVLHAFMRRYDFATLVSASPEGLVTSHVPVLTRSDGGVLQVVGHIARANTHWHKMNGTTATVVIFHGPHGYVSPTWYETAPSVPTWNYGVVHAHGRPIVNNDEAFLRGVLDDLVRRYEASRPNGWRTQDVPAADYQRMLGAIVGFQMPVERLEGKFKLGQNRSAEDRRRTIAGLDAEASPEAALLAEFMRRHTAV